MAAKNNEEILKFSKEQLDEIVPELRHYLTQTLDTEFSEFQCKLLLKYISEHIGKYYYNAAIDDAVSMMSLKVEDLYILSKE